MVYPCAHIGEHITQLLITKSDILHHYTDSMQWNIQCSKDKRSHLQVLIADHLYDSNSQQESLSILFSFPVQLITRCWGKRGFGLSVWEMQCKCLLKVIRTFESRDGSFKMESRCINFHLPTVLSSSFFKQLVFNSLVTIRMPFLKLVRLTTVCRRILTFT